MFLWVVLAIFFIILGWGVHKKRWHFLISGYNMMSEEEKAQVDVENLAKAIGWMCYVLAVLFIGMGLLMEFKQWGLLWVFTVAIIFVPLYFVYYSRRFYTKGIKSSGKGSPKAKMISTTVTVVTLIGAGIIIYFSMQPTKFDVDSGAFTISGMYGDTMSWEQISDIQLVRELPDIAVRTNGSAIGSKLKGNFKLENGDEAKLFVDKSVPVFITFTRNGELYYLNKPSVEATEKLYEEMMSVWAP
jgi:formate hydrogenlyase subunit 3/multisubunit Na+/H+ antiporter MnhD subunit